MLEVRADDTTTSRLVGPMKSDIGVRLLGPVEARAITGWLTVPPQQRILLALLALQAGQVIPVRELIDAIWPEAPPASARASLQVMITRLRHILAGQPGGVVERCGDGYRLLIAPGSIDVQRFRRLARAARDAPTAEEAIAAFDEALALWRGPALADVPATGRIDAIRFALAEERLSALLDRIASLLDIGRHRDAAEELTGLAAVHPLAERLAGLLMVALYRCGRQVDALQVFRDVRTRLSNELAIEPGPELQSLHQQILAGDLALSAVTSRPISPVAQQARGQELAFAGADTPLVPRQLPTGAAHFTGRAGDMRVLDNLRERVGSFEGPVAIAAISGTAGVGKTTLALHWAHQNVHKFPDGQLYVNLRAFGPSSAPMKAADAIRGFLDALGVRRDRRPRGIEALAAFYRTALADKRILVVLDNAADEDQVRLLLPGSGGCLVLITSRRRLAGLATCEGATLLTLDVLSQSEALELLAGRLGDAATVSADEAATQLALLCGGLPLALAIAAVRAAENPRSGLAALSTQMQDIGGRLDVLDIGERAGSVRTAFSWSYKNLSRQAARLFRLLAAHPGPDISLAAAASLAGCPVVRTRRILAELADAHVITEYVTARWMLHDLLRAYASEQAQSEDDQTERAEAWMRVLDHYVHTAWSAAIMLRPGRDPGLELDTPRAGVKPETLQSPDDAMAWLDAEYRVLVEAISCAAATGCDTHAWQLPWALTDYFTMTGRWNDLTATMQTALEAATRTSDVAGQARAHHGLGRLRLPPAAVRASRGHLAQALGLYTELGDSLGQASVHSQLGIILDQEGRTQEALAQAQQALHLARAAGHRGHEARALNLIGWLHAHQGHHDLALKRCRFALVLYRGIRDRLGEAGTWDSIGYVSHLSGNFDEAAEHYYRALQLSRDVRCRSAQATILDHLGDNCAAAGSPEVARDFWHQALAILDELQFAETSGIRQKLRAPGRPVGEARHPPAAIGAFAAS
jgi:DNA-binding SARP family transcriptional activator/tetratricopeptide (TPR) repeat protein